MGECVQNTRAIFFQCSASSTVLPSFLHLTSRPGARAGGKKQHPGRRSPFRFRDSSSSVPVPRLITSESAAVPTTTRSPSTGTVRFFLRRCDLSHGVVVPSAADASCWPRSRRLPPKQNRVTQLRFRRPRRRPPLATSSCAVAMHQWLGGRARTGGQPSRPPILVRQPSDKND